MPIVTRASRVGLLFLLALCPAIAFLYASAGAASVLPENLALKSRASSSSEFSDAYSARFAVDGKIPAPGGQDDAGQAWCVQGQTHRSGAELRLEWSSPVKVAEVVYYARTGWFAEEGWKEAELFVGDEALPRATVKFGMGHGPQRITLTEPAMTSHLRLRFTSSYGGANPGASEVQVFGSSPDPAALGTFIALPPGRPILPDTTPFTNSPALEAGLRKGALGIKELVLIRRKELNPSHVYTYHVEGFDPGGGLCVLDVTAGQEAGVREIVPSPEGQILDCDVSYDGREVLFSWRRGADKGYQVFVVNTDGTGLRQLTEGAHHNYNACWLPDGGIAFLSTRSARFAYCWISPVGLLHRMARDGSKVVRLSANIVNDFTPSVLEDGRIIYSRWEYVDKPAIPIQSLWAIHPDGTGLAGFFGNRVLSPATFMEARSIPGTGKVLCVLTSHNGPCRGAIGIINPARGNNAQDAISNITPEVNIGSVDEGNGNNIQGPYESPFPLDAKYFLLSKRGTVFLRSYDGGEAVRLIERRGGLGFYSAKPLKARATPPILPQIQISSDHANPSNAWGYVFLHDVYRGLEPEVRRGEVKEICVVEEMHKEVRTDVNNRAFGFQFPVISCGATYAAKRVWGFADVQPDGSAFFAVPAGRPIYFMALDERGRAVQRMRTFTHLMPGETQGCVGCHEPRTQTAGLAAPLRQVAQPLRKPDWGDAVGFDFTKHVQPVLDEHCVSCHSGVKPPAKVDLSGDKTDFFNVAYESLARGRKRAGESEWDSPYVSWIPTYNGMEQNILQVAPKAWGSPRSRLADLLLSGHPDKEGRPRIRIQSREARRLLTWMDLNVPYYGTSETAYPEKPGCRRIYPDRLDATLADIAGRRCAECHKDGNVPRQVWTRITNPHLNGFLTAPLALEAGGSGACGKAIFASTDDKDYQLLLTVLKEAEGGLSKRPRMDMAGATPAEVNKSCLGH